MSLRTVRYLAPLLVPVLLLIGCSSDDAGSERASADKKTTTTIDLTSGGTTPDGVKLEDTVPNPKPQAAPDRTEYCQVWSKLMATTGKDYDTGDPNSVKAHYGEVVAVARELLGVSPIDIKGAVEQALKGAEAVASSGDTDADNTDEVRVNGQRLQEYAAEHCK